MSEKWRRFHIHGDNIVECERTLHLIERGFKEDEIRLIGPLGVPTNPEFHLRSLKSETTMEFTFFPGFGRWNHDIHQLVLDRGGTLNEYADAILSEVTSGQEVPILAMEYSGALAAGNQAWQRSGRAYSFGLAGIPFLYVGELGGYELGPNRVPKSARFPNPAVPFSYLSFSTVTQVPVLPIFVRSPIADDTTQADYRSVFGEADLENIIRMIILKEDISDVISSIEEKALAFIGQLSARARSNQTLTPAQWSSAYDYIRGGDQRTIITYLENDAQKKWSKTAYINRLTDSANELMQKTSELATGLTSSRLPICLVPSNKRIQFARLVSQIYPDISNDFLIWLQKTEPLVICWVMGFKPKGDDARPDRGLLPLARMLIGPEIELMAMIYGPAPPAHWDSLVNDPQSLMEQNGLWQAILGLSDAILIDSDSDQITTHGYISSHWQDN